MPATRYCYRNSSFLGILALIITLQVVLLHRTCPVVPACVAQYHIAWHLLSFAISEGASWLIVAVVYHRSQLSLTDRSTDHKTQPINRLLASLSPIVVCRCLSVRWSVVPCPHPSLPRCHRPCLVPYYQYRC